MVVFHPRTSSIKGHLLLNVLSQTEDIQTEDRKSTYWQALFYEQAPAKMSATPKIKTTTKMNYLLKSLRRLFILYSVFIIYGF